MIHTRIRTHSLVKILVGSPTAYPLDHFGLGGFAALFKVHILHFISRKIFIQFLRFSKMCLFETKIGNGSFEENSCIFVYISKLFCFKEALFQNNGDSLFKKRENLIYFSIRLIFTSSNGKLKVNTHLPNIVSHCALYIVAFEKK